MSLSWFLLISRTLNKTTSVKKQKAEISSHCCFQSLTNWVIPRPLKDPKQCFQLCIPRASRQFRNLQKQWKGKYFRLSVSVSCGENGREAKVSQTTVKRSFKIPPWLHLYQGLLNIHWCGGFYRWHGRRLFSERLLCAACCSLIKTVWTSASPGICAVMYLVFYPAAVVAVNNRIMPSSSVPHGQTSCCGCDDSCPWPTSDSTRSFHAAGERVSHPINQKRNNVLFYLVNISFFICLCGYTCSFFTL